MAREPRTQIDFVKYRDFIVDEVQFDEEKKNEDFFPL